MHSRWDNWIRSEWKTIGPDEQQPARVSRRLAPGKTISQLNGTMPTNNALDREWFRFFKCTFILLGLGSFVCLFFVARNWFDYTVALLLPCSERGNGAFCSCLLHVWTCLFIYIYIVWALQYFERWCFTLLCIWFVLLFFVLVLFSKGNCYILYHYSCCSSLPYFFLLVVSGKLWNSDESFMFVRVLLKLSFRLSSK